MEDKTSKEKEKSADKRIDERVHQQLVYKDNRIIDLNNVILDKERQILDLQVRIILFLWFHIGVVFRKEFVSTMKLLQSKIKQ